MAPASSSPSRPMCALSTPRSDLAAVGAATTETQTSRSTTAVTLRLSTAAYIAAIDPWGGSNTTFRKNVVQGPFGGGQYTGGVELNQVNGGSGDANVLRGDFPSDVISMHESSNMRITNNDLQVSIREPTGAGFTPTPSRGRRV